MKFVLNLVLAADDDGDWPDDVSMRFHTSSKYLSFILPTKQNQ